MKAQFAYIPPDHKGQDPHPVLSFFRNDGQVGNSDMQFAENVYYASYGSVLHTFLGERNTITFALPVVDGDTATSDTLYSFSMQMVGELVDENVVPEATEEVSWYHNYYRPWCQQGVLQVPGFRRVIYREVYPGIDVQIYSNWLGYKFYFVVHPGADPTDILLKFQGQDSLKIDIDGSLKAYRSGRGFRFPQALAYQHIGTATVQVPWWTQYHEVHNDLLVNFLLDSYNPAYPLILDISEGFGAPPTPPTPPPGVPEWATYYLGLDNGLSGGSPLAMCELSNGGVAACGETSSISFPVFNGADMFYEANGDAFYTVFDEHYYRSSSTFWGGTEWDQATGITEYGNGIAIVGRTASAASMAWIGPSGAFVDQDDIPGTGATCFLAVFDGDVNVWQSLFGPSGALEPVGIATYSTATGDGLVIGGTVHWGDPLGFPFPVELSCSSPTMNAMPICGSAPAFVQSELGYKATGFPPPGPWTTDCWLAKFNEQFQLAWSTLFSGSSFYDVMTGLVVDPSNNHVVIVGNTQSPGLSSGCNPVAFGNAGFPWCPSSLAGSYNMNPSPGVFPNFTIERIGFIADFDDQNDLTWCSAVGARVPFDPDPNEIEFTEVYAVDARDGRIALIGMTSADEYYSTDCAPPIVANQFPKCNGSSLYSGSPNPVPTLYHAFAMQFQSANKQMLWSSLIPGVGFSEYEGDVAVGPAQQVIVAGSLLSWDAPLQWNPFFYSNVGGPLGSWGDCVVSGFDYYGNFWGTRFGGLDDDVVMSLVVTGTTDVDRVYVGGTTNSDQYAELFPYNCPPVLDPGFPPWCVPYLSVPTDIFYAQLKKDLLLNTAEEALIQAPDLVLFPNPTSGYLSFECPDCAHMSGGRVEVLDMLGERVLSEPYQPSGLHVATLVPGSYLCSILDHNSKRIYSARFILVP